MLNFRPITNLFNRPSNYRQRENHNDLGHGLTPTTPIGIPIAIPLEELHSKSTKVDDQTSPSAPPISEDIHHSTFTELLRSTKSVFFALYCFKNFETTKGSSLLKNEILWQDWCRSYFGKNIPEEFSYENFGEKFFQTSSDSAATSLNHICDTQQQNTALESLQSFIEFLSPFLKSIYALFITKMCEALAAEKNIILNNSTDLHIKNAS